MGILELFLIAVGLSMDAFAVAICKGLGMGKINYKQALVIALFFGGFQALMPLVGWAIGSQFESYISQFDHWVAFVLLAFVGGKMLFDAFRSSGDSDTCEADKPFNIKEILLMALATSIDALAVGITFAFLKVDIVSAVLFIGLITFILSFVGVLVGSRFGSKYEKPATILGGVVLILIGLKILLEHLGVISF